MGQRIIGLTGGIATGKSTVAHYLAHHHGLPVLDADEYARAAVRPLPSPQQPPPPNPILTAIAQRYGPGILLPSGELNRARLGQIVFPDEAERRWLEAQIHPYVRQRFALAMEALTHCPVVVQAIPLLFEANLTDQVTEVWVVVCNPVQQQQRLMARNGLSAAQASDRIAAQLPLAEKAARADVVLDNSGPPGHLATQLHPQIDAALRG